MTRALLILALVLGFSAVAYGQPIFITGVEHTIADAYLSAADSVHDFGLVSLVDCDSVQIQMYTQDSLYVAFLPRAVWGTATADTSTSAALSRAFTAAGGATIFWPAISGKLASGGYAPAIKLQARVYSVGSEVASSGKKFRVWIHRYGRGKY